MKNLLFILGLTIMFVGCSKQNGNTTLAVTKKYGKLTFTNNSTKLCSIFVDGVSIGDVASKASITVDQEVGNHTARMMEKNGYTYYRIDINYKNVIVHENEETVVPFSE